MLGAAILLPMVTAQMLQFAGFLFGGGALVAFGYFVGRKGVWDAMKENAATWRENAELAKSDAEGLTKRVTKLEVLYEQEQAKRLKEEKLRELLELEVHYFDIVLHLIAQNDNRLPKDLSEQLKIVLTQKELARKEAKGAYLDWEIEMLKTSRMTTTS